MATLLVRRLSSLTLSKPTTTLKIPSISKCYRKELFSWRGCLTAVTSPTRTETENGCSAAGSVTPLMSGISNRSFSSVDTTAAKQQRKNSLPIVTSEDGRQSVMISMPRTYKKLKPFIVKRRLAKMKVYEGKERDIRYSPFRLNLICRLVAGMPLQEAMTQLEFCRKNKAPLVKKVLKRTSSVAEDRDGIPMSALEVAECFATQGHHVKGIRIMGRGRMGRTKKRYSHLRVVLREIDFPLRIYQARSLNQKRKWVQRQLQAEKDAEIAQAEREELAMLEKQAAIKRKEQEKK